MGRLELLHSHYGAIAALLAIAAPAQGPRGDAAAPGHPCCLHPLPWGSASEGCAFAQGVSRLISSLLNEMCDIGPARVFL